MVVLETEKVRRETASRMVSISAEPWQEQQKQGCCTRGEAIVERKSVQLAWLHHHCVHRLFFAQLLNINCTCTLLSTS
uniref:Eukaryotic initiation factor 4E-2 n=1 Tax=Drosophila melanogaster TaxID=7227 RepID=Q683T1_DROME|nr:eukaryotic initiation factor 4E-2 [Drosophila melanogaster]